MWSCLLILEKLWRQIKCPAIGNGVSTWYTRVFLIPRLIVWARVVHIIHLLQCQQEDMIAHFFVNHLQNISNSTWPKYLVIYWKNLLDLHNVLSHRHEHGTGEHLLYKLKPQLPAVLFCLFGFFFPFCRLIHSSTAAKHLLKGSFTEECHDWISKY